MTFRDFPARRRRSIRTTDPTCSTFAAIRHRTSRPVGCPNGGGMLHVIFGPGLCARGGVETVARLRGAGEGHHRSEVQEWYRGNRGSRIRQSASKDRRLTDTPNTTFDNGSPFMTGYVPLLWKGIVSRLSGLSRTIRVRSGGSGSMTASIQTALPAQSMQQMLSGP